MNTIWLTLGLYLFIGFLIGVFLILRIKLTEVKIVNGSATEQDKHDMRYLIELTEPTGGLPYLLFIATATLIGVPVVVYVCVNRIIRRVGGAFK